MKVLKILTLTVVILIVTIVLFIVLNSQDQASVADSDLLLEPVGLLPETENAYYVLLPLVEENDFSEKILTDKFMAASNKLGYQCPTTVNDYSLGAELCPLNHIRNIGWLTVNRATSSLAVGNVQDAIDSSLAVVRVADKLAESGSMLEQLVSLALYRFATSSLQALADSGLLTTAQSSSIVETLEQHGPDSKSVSRMYQVEYQRIKSDIDFVTTGGIRAQDQNINNTNSYSWHPNQTTNQFAELYRLVITLNEQSCNSVATDLEQKLETRVEKMAADGRSPLAIISPNGIGKLFIAIVVGSFNNIREIACETEADYTELIAKFK